MATDKEYFIDPPDFLIGTKKEWQEYLDRLKKIENPSFTVRQSIAEAEEQVASMQG